ncbi:unnamed protein product, partial [Rotaria magnacalcarata]
MHGINLNITACNTNTVLRNDKYSLSLDRSKRYE